MTLKHILWFLTVWVVQWGAITMEPVLAVEPVVVYAGTSVEPLSLDAAQSSDGGGSLYTSNIFDTLVEVNPLNNNLEPALALSWEVKEKGTLWIFKLRRGIKFQDGCDFNADAVVFSFQRQYDRNFKYHYYEFVLFREIFPTLKEVKKIDSYTVAFYLTEPFYPFLASLSSTCGIIVSPQAVKKYGKEFLFHPVGTGPFYLKAWHRGKRLVLAQNPYYWREKPFIDEFNMLVEPNNLLLHGMFNRQNLDINFSFSISRAQGMNLLHWVKVHHSIQISTNYFAFNFKRKLMQRKNLRKALLYMWDSRYLTYVYQKYIFPTASFIPVGMLGYDPGIPTDFFSEEKARMHLKQENTTTPLTLTLLMTGDGELEKDFIALYTNKLKSIGIHLKTVNVPYENYIQRIANGDFDLTYTGWVADYLDTHSLIFPMFSKDLLASGMANLVSPLDKELLPLVQQASVQADAGLRGKLYQTINRRIHEEVLCIPISHGGMEFFYNQSRLSNIQVDTLGNLNLRVLKKK